MDADALSFHSAKPCHLSLGELMDGCGELGAHLLECDFSGYI
jgi:hypothetical protein